MQNAVAEKFDDIHADIAANVTKIYMRGDILTAVDLVYHSVLRFVFRGKPVAKGWVEGLIIGDTREGKSESVEGLVRHYKAGEFVTGESASFAGLMGGIQNIGKRNTVTWGKIPLNDGRLVAIDEVSGMGVDKIELFSGIRSSGIAQITKILTEKTWARTRLLWISNTRSGRDLETYNYGVLAVKELMGKAEDVSRLDFALTVAHREVPQRIIDRGDDTVVEHVYTSEVCSALVLWAWTRVMEDIVWTKEAEEAVLDYAEEEGKLYSAQIPIVQPAEQRIKLARMAVSAACRVFSTEDGEHVLVKPEHAEFVHNWLTRIYDKPSMGYRGYSDAVMSAQEDGVVSQDVLDEYRRFAEGTVLTQLMMSSSVFRKFSLADAVGWEKDEVQRFISWGFRRSFLLPVASGFVKTPAFTTLLKQEASLGHTVPFDINDDEDPY